MKKLLIILFLSICSTYSFAQLTEGKYKILSVKGFVDGKTAYDNFFEENVAIVRVTPKLINIVIGGYSVLTYTINEHIVMEENNVYNVMELQSGNTSTLLFQRMKEYPQIDGGMLIIKRSENYADIFSVLKEE